MLRCHLYDCKGSKKLLSFEATPICGVDFCDHCGDCLDCQWEDECAGQDDVVHRWVLYANDVEQFLQQREDLSEGVVKKIKAAVRAVKGEGDG